MEFSNQKSEYEAIEIWLGSPVPRNLDAPTYQELQKYIKDLVKLEKEQKHTGFVASQLEILQSYTEDQLKRMLRELKVHHGNVSKKFQKGFKK